MIELRSLTKRSPCSSSPSSASSPARAAVSNLEHTAEEMLREETFGLARREPQPSAG